MLKATKKTHTKALRTDESFEESDDELGSTKKTRKRNSYSSQESFTQCGEERKTHYSRVGAQGLAQETIKRTNKWKKP